jgi:hypothetical protein
VAEPYKPFGVKITKVGDGIFKTMGIKLGFIILRINDENIKSSEDVESALSGSTDSISFEGFYQDQPNSYLSFQQSFPRK